MFKYTDVQNSSKEITFHVIEQDFPTKVKQVFRINKLMEKLIKKGVIKPLPKIVFNYKEIKTAYRYKKFSY